MDFETSRQVILRQGIAADAADEDRFIHRLRAGKPPIPGQVTSLLLALKVVFEGLQKEPALDRDLVHALFNLAYESQRYFDAAQTSGVVWPPMLADDLKRIAAGVRAIATNQPPEPRSGS